MTQTKQKRIVAIDLARGIAVALMILSHGVNGLITFEQFSSWGMVPVHLITKISSTTFFLIFGMSLAVSFAPATENQEVWPAKRKKLVLRGLVILFWYKVLTIIEMSHLHDREEILDALLYRSFPSYAEILGFYAIALLWIPLVLPLWQRSSFLLKCIYPLFFTFLTYVLTKFYDFGGIPQIKALLVEAEGYYTWGQLSRAPLVFLGLLIGYFISKSHNKPKTKIAGSLAMMSLLLFGSYVALYSENLYESFYSLALNEGKHPPELPFILFSLSGALMVISLTLITGPKTQKLLTPFTLIGKDTLTAFVFHLSVLFVFYRYLLDLWLKVSYLEALGLTGALIVMTAGWIKLNFWRKRYEGSQISARSGSHTHNLNPHNFNPT